MGILVEKNQAVIVLGLGDFADVVSFILNEKIGAKVVCYTVNKQYLERSEYHGVPVIPFEEINEYYPPTEYAMVIGFIGKKMFQQRALAFNQAKEMGYELPNVIHPSAAVDAKKIGQSNIIFHNVSVEHHCEIGDGNIIWQNVICPHHNKIGNFNNLAPAVSLSGYASIHSHCFIGNNVSIKNKVHIHDFAYIGAGTYVYRDVASRTVWVPPRSYPLPEKDPFDFL